MAALAQDADRRATEETGFSRGPAGSVRETGEAAAFSCDGGTGLGIRGVRAGSAGKPAAGTGPPAEFGIRGRETARPEAGRWGSGAP